MTEQSPEPRRNNTVPRKSLPFVILGLVLLLAANIAVYLLIIRHGISPNTTLPMTQTAGKPAPESVLNAVPASKLIMTFTPWGKSPPSETPGLLKSTDTPLTDTPVPTRPPVITKTPAPTTVLKPSLTPVFGSCQYTLKPGPKDFLYAIYWNWQINKNIPVLQNFYAKIQCAALLSNRQCSYQAAYPGITQPGWVLILPGVTKNMCLYHGGTPLP